MDTVGLDGLRDAVTAGCPLTLDIQGTRDHEQSGGVITRIVSRVTLRDGVTRKLLLDAPLVEETESESHRWPTWHRRYDVATRPSTVRAGLLDLQIDGFVTVECNASRSEDSHVSLLINERSPPSLTWQECGR
jgi:hypothetical protein